MCHWSKIKLTVQEYKNDHQFLKLPRIQYQYLNSRKTQTLILKSLKKRILHTSNYIPLLGLEMNFKISLLVIPICNSYTDQLMLQHALLSFTLDSFSYQFHFILVKDISYEYFFVCAEKKTHILCWLQEPSFFCWLFIIFILFIFFVCIFLIAFKYSSFLN